MLLVVVILHYGDCECRFYHFFILLCNRGFLEMAMAAWLSS